MTEDDLKLFLTAVGTANSHPRPHEYAEAVIAHYKELKAIPVVTEPVAEVAASLPQIVV